MNCDGEMKRCKSDDFTIKRNGHKNKRGYGMLTSWNEKNLKSIDKSQWEKQKR